MTSRDEIVEAMINTFQEHASITGNYRFSAMNAALAAAEAKGCKVPREEE